MIFKSILVPVDGSPASDAAVALAIQLAKEGAALVFCHVVQIPLPAHDAGGFAREQIMEEETQRAHEVLEAALKRAAAAGVTAKTVLVGDPLHVVDAVLDAAKDARADLIVMGTHGRTGIVRALLGSKTADVIARALVPVLVASHVSA